MVLKDLKINPKDFTGLYEKARGRKVIVALSSGGLRIVCHLPLLKILEELEIKVDELWGVSAGSIAGGLWASGRSAAYIEEAILSLNKSQLYEFYPISAIRACFPSMDASKSGLLSGKKIEKLLYTLIGDKVNPLVALKDFRVLAYNRTINSKVTMRIGDADGTIEVFQMKDGHIKIEKGDLVDMLRASFATPVMFTPKRLNGQLYIDGGIAENYPVLTAFTQHMEQVKQCNDSRGLLILGVNISYSGEITRRKTNIITSVAESYDIIGAEFTRLHIGLLEEMIKGCGLDCEVVTIDPEVHQMALTDLKRVPETLQRACERTISTLKNH